MHLASHPAQYLGDLSKQLVVISLLEVDLVIDGISHLSLIPLLYIIKEISESHLLSVGRLQHVSSSLSTPASLHSTSIPNTYHVVNRKSVLTNLRTLFTSPQNSPLYFQALYPPTPILPCSIGKPSLTLLPLNKQSL